MSLALGCALFVAGLLVPGAAGAATLTEQTGVGELSVTPNGFSLQPDGGAVTPPAHAAGSSVGRIPRCKMPNPGSIRRPKHIRRFLLCFVKQFVAPLVVVEELLLGATSGAGELACPVLTEQERIRLGGAACPERIRAGSAGLASRDPRLHEILIRRSRVGDHGEAILILRHPRDAVLLELVVVPHRYWRISDVSDLYP